MFSANVHTISVSVFYFFFLLICKVWLIVWFIVCYKLSQYILVHNVSLDIQCLRNCGSCVIERWLSNFCLQYKTAVVYTYIFIFWSSIIRNFSKLWWQTAWLNLFKLDLNRTLKMDKSKLLSILQISSKQCSKYINGWKRKSC